MSRASCLFAMVPVFSAVDRALKNKKQRSRADRGFAARGPRCREAKGMWLTAENGTRRQAAAASRTGPINRGSPRNTRSRWSAAGGARKARRIGGAPVPHDAGCGWSEQGGKCPLPQKIAAHGKVASVGLGSSHSVGPAVKHMDGPSLLFENRKSFFFFFLTLPASLSV